MSWVVAILLAVAGFAIAVLAFRLPRVTWTSLAAALVFGIAGYTLQASPNLPGAPKSLTEEPYADDWQMVESRNILIDGALASSNPNVLHADAFARQGQFEDAAGFLNNALSQNPDDFEAWVALGNVLTEQADGILTQASVFAYSRANEIAPDNPAPAYFLGLSLIRQGRMMEARNVWSDALQDMGEGESEAHLFMADRVGRLDDMLLRAGAMPQGEAE